MYLLVLTPERHDSITAACFLFLISALGFIGSTANKLWLFRIVSPELLNDFERCKYMLSFGCWIAVSSVYGIVLLGSSKSHNVIIKSARSRCTIPEVLAQFGGNMNTCTDQVSGEFRLVGFGILILLVSICVIIYFVSSQGT